MKKLSTGTLITLVFLLFIAALGFIFAVRDYTRYEDTSTFWWPGICLTLFVVVLWRGARTDGRATALALLLLGAAAGACQRPTLEARAEHAAPDVAVRTYTNAQGFEVVVVDTVARGW